MHSAVEFAAEEVNMMVLLMVEQEEMTMERPEPREDVAAGEVVDFEKC